MFVGESAYHSNTIYIGAVYACKKFLWAFWMRFFNSFLFPSGISGENGAELNSFRGMQT